MTPTTADVIGGFPFADPNCKGCGKPLTIDNAWMTDGCPCNTPLRVNSMNETRWRLLMQLQQRQSQELEEASKELKAQQWLIKMAEQEANGIVSVGGLATMIEKPDEQGKKLVEEVVAIIREAEAAARLAEREACAKLVDTFKCGWRSSGDLLAVAGAIRAREEAK